MVKFSIYYGDITKLAVQAIVNPANETGLGCEHGPKHCLDGAIHAAAGPLLREECKRFGGLPTGVAKISKAYNLPCSHVIHVTGPRNKALGSGLSIAIESCCDFEMLAQCYVSCLEVAKANGIKEIAFSCISTGLFGFPKSNSASIAIRTVKKWLDEHESDVSRIIFCVFSYEDYHIYQNVFQCAHLEDEATYRKKSVVSVEW